ncbi:MAG: hypothetical protein QM784_01370 [Polyangiaceae bacterium]
MSVTTRGGNTAVGGTAAGGTAVGGTTATGGTGVSSTTTSTDSPKDLTVSLPGPAHWFVAAPILGELSLVGVDDNYRVSVDELPRLVDMGFSSSGVAKFSKTGHRVCYSGSSASTEIGIIELSTTEAHAKVMPIPSRGNLRYFDCVGWLNETMVLLNGYTTSQAKTQPEYVVVSTVPNERIPDLAPVPPDQLWSMSPNRKLWFESSHATTTTNASRTLYRVRDDGFRGEQVLYQASPSGEYFWSRNATRLFTASAKGAGSLPHLEIYDIPESSGVAIPIPLPATLLEGYVHSCSASSEGRYLAKGREYADGLEHFTDLVDLETGKSAVITNPNLTGLNWLGDTLLATYGNGLLALRVTPSVFNSGSVTLSDARDQSGLLTGVTDLSRLTDRAVLVTRVVGSLKTLQILRETTGGLATEDILPGSAGNSTLGTLLTSSAQNPYAAHRQFEAAAYPSYHFLDFAEGSLFRSVRMRDYFKEEDAIIPVPELLGMIGRYPHGQASMWLYLEGPNEGRMITLPLPPTDAKDGWFFPESWPR